MMLCFEMNCRGAVQYRHIWNTDKCICTRLGPAYMRELTGRFRASCNSQREIIDRGQNDGVLIGVTFFDNVLIDGL